MNANHTDNIEINASLQAAAGATASFGVVAYVREGITLGGDRIRLYADRAEVAVDELAGEVDATTTAAATVAFSQQPRPSLFAVIRKAADPETYVQALDAARAELSWYVTTIDSRDLADIDAVSDYQEALPSGIFIPQSSDSGWLTSGAPAAFAGYVGKERTALIYHDTDGEFADVGWSVARATFSPDTQSAPWDGRARAVAGLATQPNTTQKAFLDANNANHGLEYRSAPFFVDAGKNGAGRPLHEIVSLDWFQARLGERTADLKLKYSDLGLKVPINEEGQNLLLSIVDGLLQDATTARHFNPGQTRATAVPITAEDLSNERLCFTVEGQFTGSARKFKFNLFFTRDPINTTGA